MSSLGTFQNEIHEELKNAKCNVLEDLIYRLQLTHDEIIGILEPKYIVGSTKGYTLPPGINEIIDIIFMLKSLLLKEVNITFDDVILKSNLTTNKTIRFTKRSFFYVYLGFTQSRLGELGDIPGFIQLIPGSYKSDKQINITGIDRVRLKADCVQGSIVNGVREPILYSFALSSKPGYKIYDEPKIELFKKVNKSILSHIRFYLEDDNYKAVDFYGETICFTCQLIKI